MQLLLFSIIPTFELGKVRHSELSNLSQVTQLVSDEAEAHSYSRLAGCLWNEGTYSPCYATTMMDYTEH